MASVVVFTRDLLFGSRVQAALVAAGHEVWIVGTEQRVRELLAEPRAQAPDVLVVDLTDEQFDGTASLEALGGAHLLGATRTLAYYAHVDTDVRARAEAAGFDLVVPRSRMAREAAELIARLL